MEKDKVEYLKEPFLISKFNLIVRGEFTEGDFQNKKLFQREMDCFMFEFTHVDNLLRLYLLFRVAVLGKVVDFNRRLLTVVSREGGDFNRRLLIPIFNTFSHCSRKFEYLSLCLKVS